MLTVHLSPLSEESQQDQQPPQTKNTNVSLHVNNHYRMIHHKFMVIDDTHVLTGSYNFASSANKNAENVLVVWNDPELAASYLKQWRQICEEAMPFTLQGESGEVKKQKRH